MFAKIKEAMEIDKKYKRRIFFRFIPITIVLLLAIILLLFNAIKLNTIAHTQPYIPATLIDVEVYNFENTIDSKMVNINGKLYQLPATDFPAHLRNGDKLIFAVDNEGNILGTEAYMVEGQLYKDGHAVNTNLKLKEVARADYDEETRISQKDANVFKLLNIVGILIVLIVAAIYVYSTNEAAFDVIQDKEFMDYQMQEAARKNEERAKAEQVTQETPKKRGRPKRGETPKK